MRILTSSKPLLSLVFCGLATVRQASAQIPTAPAAPTAAPASTATPAPPNPPVAAAGPAPGKVPMKEPTEPLVANANAPLADPNPLLPGVPDAPPVDQLPALLPAAQPATPTTNVTVNLLQILVKKGVLTHGEATGMIEQAKIEAEQAKAALEVAQELAPQDGDVRVTYVPQVVKDEIKDSIKADVLAEAKTDGWTAPNEAPEWTQRLKIYGDVRTRYASSFLEEKGNENTGQFPNFHAINTGAPYDVAGTLFSPQYNTDTDRDRFQLRARLGFDFDLDESWSAGMRIVTGHDSSPVAQNQNLGSALNGSAGGNFSKYPIWVDRAFIKYHKLGERADEFHASFGRFDNPFLSTPLIFSQGIGFDGISIGGRKSVTDRLALAANFCYSPIYNTDFNFPSNQPNKFESLDKHLYAAQLTAEIRPTDDIDAKFAVAYYDFKNVEGRLSEPYIPLTPQDAGNTDGTRPSFAQRGNTYRPLRQIVPSPINGFGTLYQYQYFGLASPFQNLAYTARIDFNMWEPYQLTLLGEYVENVSWDRDAINRTAINNRGADPLLGQIGDYEGSGNGWLMRIQFGKPKLEKRGDWYTWFDYRQVGSDAVIDGLNEDDLGGGGTNMQGYTLGAYVALSKRVSIGARWLSAHELAGPPLKSDIFMLDIQADF